MKKLLIDIETYSDVDLTKGGVYRYVEGAEFSILLFSYSIDYAPAVIVDLAQGETIPQDVREALTDPAVVKLAHNMVFEITCINKFFSLDMDVSQWQDTMIYGAYLGLPLSLSQLGEVLRLDKQKMKEGKSLITFFSKPFKGARRMPEKFPEKWDVYKAYCLRDVDTEVEIAKKLENKVNVPDWEREVQILDYTINKRGVRVDDTLARNAVEFWNRCSSLLEEEAKELTGLDNPNSVLQLKDWCARQGVKVNALDKAAIKELLDRIFLPSKVRRLLEIRRELGKTSVKKYEAMLAWQCEDGRAHGITQYYGTVTGRFSGRGVQLQNLPQNHIPDIEYARNLLYTGDYETMELGYASIPDTLSQLIRTGFIPSEGNIFHVCDFSAIEARVTAWVSGEQWVLDAFKSGGDIYCVTASRMFGVEVTKHGDYGHLRQPGKVAVLACGYGGGPTAFDNMAKAYGLKFTEDEKARYVKQWRNANPNTVKVWEIIEKAAKACLVSGRTIAINRGITFSYKYGAMFIKLPSGRSIVYPRAEVVCGEKGEYIQFERMNQTTKNWEIADTWGGKLLENIVQAIARDILCIVMLKAEKKGFEIVFHVHDEIIVDCPDKDALPKIEEIFAEEIPWAKGLPLKGAGYSTPFYMKD